MINIIKFVLFLCGLKSDFCKYKKPLNSLIRYHEAYAEFIDIALVVD